MSRTQKNYQRYHSGGAYAQRLRSRQFSIKHDFLHFYLSRAITRSIGKRRSRTTPFYLLSDADSMFAFKSIAFGILSRPGAIEDIIPWNNPAALESRGEPLKNRTLQRELRARKTRGMKSRVISELEKGPQPQPPRSSEELEDLHKLLHFPEEVALRLTESEYQLFYQVPPQDYLRHVEQDQTLQKPPARPSPSPSRSCSNPSTTNSSTQTEDPSSSPVAPAATVFSNVQILINRFNEVRWETLSSRPSRDFFPK